MSNKIFRGIILQNLRNHFGYTQTDIAKKIGVTQNAYSGYEIGRNEPSIDTLIKLSNIFIVSMDFITGKSLIDEINKNDYLFNEETNEYVLRRDLFPEEYYDEKEISPEEDEIFCNVLLSDLVCEMSKEKIKNNKKAPQLT